jgi:quinol monooxygenase YgiN
MTVATIDETADVFTLVNTFHTSRERQDAIVQSLRGFTERVARAFPGFVAASVHASLDGARVVNYVQWKSRADLDAMLASPEAKVHMAQVGSLADKVDPVAYRVAYVSSPR